MFLSNEKTADKYIVNSVNYLISAPIEIFIIETLWSITVGSLLDESLSKSTYGNRVKSNINNIRKNNIRKNNKTYEEDSNNGIFKSYISNYNKWRDQGINKAIDIVTNEKEDVSILSLDLKSFYYNINIDFDEIAVFIKERQRHDLVKISLLLNNLLYKIHLQYKKTNESRINETHPDSENAGIPIGFISSGILANWHLKNFDIDIENEIRPAYYGRYVDDILLVFKSPKFEKNKNANKVDDFIEKNLGSFITKIDHTSYKLAEKYHSIPLQKDKLILHFFDKNHSLAGLKVFKQEIENRSSAFRFLPDEHMSNDLEKFAYDILYDGSVNKFRSIIGLAENETELSKYLSSRTIAHRLCNLPSDEGTLKQISLFFKGENALRFSRLWEKVLSYYLITNKYNFTASFYKNIKSYINNIEWNSNKNPELQLSLKEGLNEYIDISLCLTLSLLDQRVIFNEEKSRKNGLKKNK